MPKIFVGFVALFTIAIMALCLTLKAEPKTTEFPQQTPFNQDDWVLTFQDDFNARRWDHTKWTPRDPWEVVRNNELQGYQPHACKVSDGTLKLRCEKRPSSYGGARKNYTSGMMTTSGKFAQKYGRFEIRCKVPKGKGLWPAFWMLPDPPSWPPEIDILEFLCHDTNKVYMTNHWPHPKDPKSKSLSNTGEFVGPDFAADFHTFAIEWEAGMIRWYVDGIERHRSTSNVPDVRMFMMVNLAVGGWSGNPDRNTQFPADFEVDYIKAWRRK